MYKILTKEKNQNILKAVLLNDEKDYLEYINDNNYKNEEGFKDILFGEPKTYPTILVTHFRTSFNRFCNHEVYGEYIYPNSFNQ